MRFEFIAEYREVWPINLMCRVLDVSESGYYDSINRTLSARKQRRMELLDRIIEIHESSSRCYGSPRIHVDLLEQGEIININTVASIMREHGIKAKTSKKWVPTTTDSDHDYVIAPNILNRDFTATRPDEKWVSDITYLWTSQGWVYLAAVMDLFSRRIVGWAIADNMQAELVCKAIQMAIESRQPTEPLLYHSDRGIQYVSEDFQEYMKPANITCSMSRKGNCWDNAPIESFWSTLKRELGSQWLNKSSVRPAVFEYIEIFYNRQRLHSTLNYVSPAAFEKEYQAA